MAPLKPPAHKVPDGRGGFIEHNERRQLLDDELNWKDRIPANPNIQDSIEQRRLWDRFAPNFQNNPDDEMPMQPRLPPRIQNTNYGREVPMDELLNIIRREVHRTVQALVQRPRNGVVTSWDPKTHSAKVRLEPDGVETGWIPVGNHHAGNGYGTLIGLEVGEQVEIGFQEGDISSPRITGRLHSDEDKPPEVQSGEMLFKHKSGSTVFFDKDGNVHIKSKGNVFINGSGETP